MLPDFRRQSDVEAEPSSDKMEAQPFLNNGETSRKDEPKKSTTRIGVWALYIIGIIAIFTITFRSGMYFGLKSDTTADSAVYSAGPRNSTLGFGEIILLNLPERTDRRDAVSLICSASGISITKIINAVKGDVVVDKAKPVGNHLIDEKHLGSWRTHLDAFRYIVDNGIETALIFEDDVDWYD